VLLRIRRLLFEECDTSKICSDHLCRLYPDARELLDPVSNSLYPVERHDVLCAARPRLLKADGDLQGVRSSFHMHDALVSPSGEDNANMHGDQVSLLCLPAVRAFSIRVSATNGGWRRMLSASVSSARQVGALGSLSRPTPVKHKSAIAHIWLSRFTIASAGAFTASQKQSLFEEPFGLQAVAILRCSKSFAVAR
jgi:hypothetical protein